MKVIRLNYQYRQKIAGLLLSRAFDSEEKQLRTDQHVLGDLVYSDVYSAEVLRKMRALPEGYLPELSCMCVSFGGQVGEVEFGVARLVASCHSERNRPVVSYSSQHSFSETYLGIETLKNDLRARRGLARRTAMGVLESVSTVRQLLEAWPEVRVVLGDLGDDKPVTALTVPVADLNRQFGLDPVEAKSEVRISKEKVLRSSTYGKGGAS